jgi:hypothetical protein
MSTTKAWMIFGCVTVVALFGFILVLSLSVNGSNVRKTRAIRVARIEACRGIVDEPLRVLCILEGGRGEPPLG